MLLSRPSVIMASVVAPKSSRFSSTVRTILSEQENEKKILDFNLIKIFMIFQFKNVTSPSSNHCYCCNKETISNTNRLLDGNSFGLTIDSL